jgi:hypothetical protein
VEALRKHLQKHKDQFVKVGLYRGDMESFFSKNYDLIEPRIDELEHIFGAKKELIKFICEDKIEDTVEIAYDGPCIDGDFPDHAMWGVENKDKWYIGVFGEYSKMPKQIKSTNFKISETLRKYKHRNWLSMEMHITKDGTPNVTDPCCRFGSPPGELVTEMYSNLPEILWYGAEGKVIDPIPKAKYGVELLITSSWVEKNCQAVEFPLTIMDNIKLANVTMMNGKYYVLPRSEDDHVGAVVGTGNTLKEAINKVNKCAEKLEGYEIQMRGQYLEDVQEEISKLKEFGIDF